MGNKYTAVTKHEANGAVYHNRITSVYAQTREEADARIEYELSKPGREGYLKAWKEGGRLIMINDDPATV